MENGAITTVNVTAQWQVEVHDGEAPDLKTTRRDLLVYLWSLNNAGSTGFLACEHEDVNRVVQSVPRHP